MPTELILIAGKGNYPLLLAESARQQGVRRLVALAFRGETDRGIARRVDEVIWLPMGSLDAFLAAATKAGISQAVMAGQITPTNLFRVRLDGAMIALLRQLPQRNADTIFSAVGEALRQRGVTLMPASAFMEAHMPAAGLLGTTAPDERMANDIRYGMGMARRMSALDIGQTVVVKDGVVLAVEAFEGTNMAIRRAARLGGKGIVVTKAAKPGHDMRFDIPVVGEHTLALLRKVHASVIAVEAHRAILLDLPHLARLADRFGICMIAVAPDNPDAGINTTMENHHE